MIVSVRVSVAMVLMSRRRPVVVLALRTRRIVMGDGSGRAVMARVVGSVGVCRWGVVPAPEGGAGRVALVSERQARRLVLMSEGAPARAHSLRLAGQSGGSVVTMPEGRPVVGGMPVLGLIALFLLVSVVRVRCGRRCLRRRRLRARRLRDRRLRGRWRRVGACPPGRARRRRVRVPVRRRLVRLPVHRRHDWLAARPGRSSGSGGRVRQRHQRRRRRRLLMRRLGRRRRRHRDPGRRRRRRPMSETEPQRHRREVPRAARIQDQGHAAPGEHERGHRHRSSAGDRPE